MMKLWMSLFVLLTLCAPVYGQVDHTELIKTQCVTGEDVTRTCLKCHEESARDFMETAHWRWKGPSPYVKGHEKEVSLGKINLINNY